MKRNARCSYDYRITSDSYVHSAKAYDKQHPQRNNKQPENNNKQRTKAIEKKKQKQKKRNKNTNNLIWIAPACGWARLANILYFEMTKFCFGELRNTS